MNYTTSNVCSDMCPHACLHFLVLSAVRVERVSVQRLAPLHRLVIVFTVREVLRPN